MSGVGETINHSRPTFASSKSQHQCLRKKLRKSRCASAIVEENIIKPCQKPDIYFTLPPQKMPYDIPFKKYFDFALSLTIKFLEYSVKTRLVSA